MFWFQCLEPAFLSEESAVNRYNAAALLAEKSAAVGITTEEERCAERMFQEVPGIWSQQKENESMRCVIRSFNRMITYFLRTSRTKFPDLRYEQTSLWTWQSQNYAYNSIILYRKLFFRWNLFKETVFVSFSVCFMHLARMISQSCWWFRLWHTLAKNIVQMPGIAANRLEELAKFGSLEI